MHPYSLRNNKEKTLLEKLYQMTETGSEKRKVLS